MGNQLILERLDLFVGTIEWRLLYPITYVQTLELFHSDHRTLYIRLGDHTAQGIRSSSNHAFIPHFEVDWLRERECNDIVFQGWRPLDDSMLLHDQISHCLQTFQIWMGKSFVPCING